MKRYMVYKYKVSERLITSPRIYLKKITTEGVKHLSNIISRIDSMFTIEYNIEKEN